MPLLQKSCPRLRNGGREAGHAQTSRYPEPLEGGRERGRARARERTYSGKNEKKRPILLDTGDCSSSCVSAHWNDDLTPLCKDKCPGGVWGHINCCCKLLQQQQWIGNDDYIVILWSPHWWFSVAESSSFQPHPL